eukprot:PhF_6_TR39988/c0_g1_i1/m.59352
MSTLLLMLNCLVWSSSSSNYYSTTVSDYDTLVSFTKDWQCKVRHPINTNTPTSGGSTTTNVCSGESNGFYGIGCENNSNVVTELYFAELGCSTTTDSLDFGLLPRTVMYLYLDYNDFSGTLNLAFLPPPLKVLSKTLKQNKKQSGGMIDFFGIQFVFWTC